MMKKLLLIVLLSCSSSLLPAQDLIITQKNDSLHVNITGEDEENFYLLMRNKGRIIETFIPKKNVAANRYDYYPKRNLTPYRKDYSRYRLTLDFGLGHRMLRSDRYGPNKGIAYGVSAYWFFKEFLGAGITYTGSSFSSDSSHYKGKPTKATFTQHLIGPSAIFRIYLPKRRSQLLLEPGFGYFWSRNDIEYIYPPTDLLLRSNGWGGRVILGYDYSLTRKSALGVAFSIDLGRHWLTTASLPRDAKRESETFNSLSLTIGYRFSN